MGGQKDMAYAAKLFVVVFSTAAVVFQPASVLGNAEVEALIELRASLDPHGRFLSSWTSSGDPCSGRFVGVACNEHGKVTNISLQGMGLSGTIAPAVARLRCLSGLYLHYNSLNGGIPVEISNLTELIDLYLNVNNLTGSISTEIGNMASLQVLQLCYNQLTGSIPNQLGLLKNLNILALQNNQLTGAIPASLGDLSQLVRLDLSFNNLFGSIPVKLAQVPSLAVLDLSNNSLSGSIPPDLKRLSDGFQYGNNTDLCGAGFPLLKACSVANLRNPNLPEPFGTNATGQGLLHSSNLDVQCGQTQCSKSSKSTTLIVFGSIALVAFGGIFSVLLVLSWYRRQKQKIGGGWTDALDGRMSTDCTKDVSRRSASPLMALDHSSGWDPLSGGRSGNGCSQGVSQSFRFNLEEVECATQYFSEVNLLGKSSFASTFRGILRDGSMVAVKSISRMGCKAEEVELLKGLKILTSLCHENLVGLRGFCCSRGRGECFLVYDFVSNGKLSQYLDLKDGSENKVLSWPIRVFIIKGIAEAIEYLHSNKDMKPPLVHQNISVDRVLLDHNFKPLLSGACIHKLLADDVVFSSLKSSAAMGYLAPEYTTTGRFTEKSDVYAFGVVVFQVLTGKTGAAMFLRPTELDRKLEDLADENLKGEFSKQEFAKLAVIALRCTSEAPGQRPSMEAVIQDIMAIVK